MSQLKQQAEQRYKMDANCPYHEAKCNMEDCECAKYKAYKKINEPGVIEETLKEIGFNVKDENWNSWDLLMGMQKNFASKFHKVDNFSVDEIDHWVDKYLVCIEDEIREVREHIDIVHNKKKENLKELQKEIIDILHFLMDLYIVGEATSSDIKRAYLDLYASEVKDIDDLIKFAWNNQEFELKHKLHYDYKDNFDLAMLDLSSTLLDYNGLVRQHISWKHWKQPSDEIDKKSLYKAFAKTFKSLIDLFLLVLDSPDEIKDIYVTKNIENIWRQKFDY
jgi:hypothetical protein